MANLLEVFRGVWRALRDDGTLWLNLGDSYAGGGRAGNNPDHYGKHRMFGKTGWDPGAFGKSQPVPKGLKPKNLVGIPWRVAFALQADGWYLRSDIIWHKPNCMPESVTDRPTKAHEYIFLLTKSKKYFYDAGAIREQAGLKPDISWGRNGLSKDLIPPGQTYSQHRQHRASRSGNKKRKLGAERGRPGSHLGGSVLWEGYTRNKRSVWTVATQAYTGAHFAVFPEKLIEPCILAGSRLGDIILDPFAGSGTTIFVSERLGRNSIGIELNPEYCELAKKRMDKMQINIFNMDIPDG